jgi:hypothetical protein
MQRAANVAAMLRGHVVAEVFDSDEVDHDDGMADQ